MYNWIVSNTLGVAVLGLTAACRRNGLHMAKHAGLICGGVRYLIGFNASRGLLRCWTRTWSVG